MTDRPTVARVWRGRTRRGVADEYERYNYEKGISPLIEKAMGVQTFREDRLPMVRTVEHVHVHAGGQAVVGMVGGPGGGGRRKLEDQPHAKHIAHAPERALRSPDAKGDPVSVARDGERPLPDARGNISRRTDG